MGYPVSVVAGMAVALTTSALSPPSGLAVETPSTEDVQSTQVAYVDVAVATVWAEPGIDRDVDRPAVTDPADMRAWLRNMTLAQRRWLVGKLETQALYGQQVTIIQDAGDWVEVVVHGQPTPRHEQGYPGWLPKAQLTADSQHASVEDGPFALVDARTAWLYRDEQRSEQLMELSANTRLPVMQRRGHAVRVATLDGADAWLSKGDVTVYRKDNAIPTPKGEDLADTAETFLDAPYLWAGTAGFGFDCSGFTHTVYGMHGLTIPRDAGDQFAAGTPVAEDELEPGDLVFYGYDRDPQRVHHVGIYVGDGYQIDAPIHSTTEDSHVQLVKLTEHRYYADEYVGARRYI